MNSIRLLGRIGLVQLILGLTLIAAGCTEDREALVAPAGTEEAQALAMGSQAGLWLSVENAESVYYREDADDWLTDSWVTEAQEFDVRIGNRRKFPICDLYLLVTIPAEYKDQPGWYLQVDDLVLGPDDFKKGRPGKYGFHGGSHGVYPPSGTGIFYPYAIPGILKAGASRLAHIVVWKGEVEGFKVHFDAGSNRLWSPPSHDVTVLPPVGGGEIPLEACCMAYGVCDMLPPSLCVDEMGGTPQGPGSVCEPNPCAPPPQEPEACCLPDQSCQMLPPEDCWALDGLPAGEGSDCETTTCGEIRGR